MDGGAYTNFKRGLIFVFVIIGVVACGPQEDLDVDNNQSNEATFEALGSGSGGTKSSTTTTSTTLAISNSFLPAASLGTAYTTFITSTGGGTPHKFSLVSGQLPPGLSMASSYGVQSTMISGKASMLGTWVFTVQVRDSAGRTATKALSITVKTTPPLVITNQSDILAPGIVGSAYALNLFASGGIQPYRWSIIVGQLPPGIGLSSNRLSGTPTTRGSYSFTAQVLDASGLKATRTFTINVN